MVTMSRVMAAAPASLSSRWSATVDAELVSGKFRAVQGKAPFPSTPRYQSNALLAHNAGAHDAQNFVRLDRLYEMHVEAATRARWRSSFWPSRCTRSTAFDRPRVVRGCGDTIRSR